LAAVKGRDLNSVNFAAFALAVLKKPSPVFIRLFVFNLFGTVSAGFNQVKNQRYQSRAKATFG